MVDTIWRGVLGSGEGGGWEHLVATGRIEGVLFTRPPRVDPDGPTRSLGFLMAMGRGWRFLRQCSEIIDQAVKGVGLGRPFLLLTRSTWRKRVADYRWQSERLQVHPLSEALGMMASEKAGCSNLKIMAQFHEWAGFGYRSP
jgi:hypothetical protein